MTNIPVRQSRHMRRFSTLAGPVQNIGINPKKYKVKFRSVMSYDPLIYRIWTRVVAIGSLLLVIAFALILFNPEHWIITKYPQSSTHTFNLSMLVLLALLQVFIIVGTIAASRATLKARDPVPVRPPRNLKVAFVTTRAPGEPLDMVQHTLLAMKQVRYQQGIVNIWLLDETNDEELVKFCKAEGIRHFSRKDISRWNRPKPVTWLFIRRAYSDLLWMLTLGRKSIYIHNEKPNQLLAAKTKHGNFNAWRQYLKEQGLAYDILAGVDTDHVPQINYLERLLGYFRDPDLAYVVGPQVYGNYRPGLTGLVSRWAESQASFFQSTIQRAGNASCSPMFVGTNYAVRMEVLDQIGGFQPCITEDMATGLAIHIRRNPATNKHWKSIYTPDVLAVGEGPDLWGPYFTQQWRWAAGTFDTWKRVVWRTFFRLSPRAMIHYLLMLLYYPMTAMAWLLGIASSMIYLLTGATALIAPFSQFLSLYLMTLVMQMSLYFWNRRYNVSPHEPEGSYGIPGMVISTLTAPIYFSALLGILTGKKASFVVTTKGGGTSFDKFSSFRTHLRWLIVLIGGLIYGLLEDHAHPAMLSWTFVLIIICLAPPILSLAYSLPERFKMRSLPDNQLMPIGNKHGA